MRRFNNDATNRAPLRSGLTGDSPFRIPSPDSLARREAQIRADNNGELPPGWAKVLARYEIMRQPLPHVLRAGMSPEEMAEARKGNMGANECYSAGTYFFHRDYPDQQDNRDTAAIWRESEGGDCRPLPHYYGPAHRLWDFGFLCRCDNPESHDGGARGQRQRAWIKGCHEKLDHAGKDCITYLESLEIDREIHKREWPGTYERYRMFDDLIESVRTGSRQSMRPGRSGGLFR